MTIEGPNLEGPADGGNSYDQIVQSSALIGGSSAVSVVFGVIRTKAIAVLLGPADFGLFGLYTSIVAVAECIAGMGVSSSAVRQIAQSRASGDPNQISRTSRVLLKVSVLLGLLGGAFLAIFSRQVSTITFGDDHHAGAVALLSMVVFFELLSNSQRALLQGMRRVRDLAMTAVLIALSGLCVTVPIVFFLRERGVVPSIVSAGFISLLITWSYSSKIQIQAHSSTRSKQYDEVRALLKLGFVLMTSYLMTTGAAYATRIMVLRMIGYEATGRYQAAWTLGAFYVGFILQAMGTDFYPRLTAVAADNEMCNRLVNEQTEVGLLLAGPGLLASLALAPLVLVTFYSSRFNGAVGLLRWICLGTLLQVVTWPMSYILVAKGKQTLFFATEAAWAFVSLILAFFSIRWFGLDGAGIAFVGSYLVYGVLLFCIVGRLSGFRWSTANRRTGLFFLFLIAVALAGFFLFPSTPAVFLGGSAALLSTVYSIRILVNLVALDRLPRSIESLLQRLNLISAKVPHPD